MEYYYILKQHGHKDIRFETKEDLIKYIKDHKIPYTNYIVDRFKK